MKASQRSLRRTALPFLPTWDGRDWKVEEKKRHAMTESDTPTRRLAHAQHTRVSQTQHIERKGRADAHTQTVFVSQSTPRHVSCVW